MPKAGPDVYRALREAISDGSLPANEPLREERLAASLGVSRTPVREALVRLTAEGLIERDGSGRVRISVLSAEDLDEVFALRDALERLAIRYACKVQDPAGLSELRRIHAASEDAVAADDVERLLELNTQFHAALNALSGKRRLQNFIELLRDQSRRYRVLALYEESERRQSVAEHGRLIELVAAGKPEDAMALLRTHFERPRQRLVAYVGPPRPRRAPIGGGQGR